ncbi:amylo-alpha-1,6-glucosidase [Danxiaibacter flavus]|uniref:Amylo-alpha-1,6-glucosidase n=1 Tax=Danxiaibacter flavus TaxID=3049108 RepID=A0ABV3ZCH4_9BACT|nr:amylo-alpha-1,6-glucosidase [Chitinophagaceae bacterium DXS]
MRTKFILLSILMFAFSASLVAQNKKELAKKILSDKKMDTVYAMAEKLLAKGFNAGDGYPQVWIRDMNTFIETSCKVYNTDTIRKNLLTFYRLQQPNGEIVDGYVLKGHVTWNDPNIYTSDLDPGHVGFKNTVETDQETSLIQAIAKYIRVTGDASILNEKIGGKTVLERMAFSIDYLLKNRYSEKYQLLTGATTQDWGDVQIEGGAVVDVDENTHWAIDVYDNAMFVIALNDMIGFTKLTAGKQKWMNLKQLTSTNIRKYLWDEKNHKFIPHLYVNGSPFPADFDENKMHYHGGTAVAIEAGLLSKEEIALVNKQMLKNVALSGAPSIGLTIYPPYPEGIYKNSNASKLYVYQNGGDWHWFGGRMIQQLVANGFPQEAYDEIQPMLSIVLKHSKFYEWYGVHGEPSGSGDFKGSAGVLSTAIVMLRDWAQKNK